MQKVQRQMTIDDNLPVLELFLRYWEFIPTERSYMIKNASLPFIECYLQKRSLGKQGEEFARNGRFGREFVARYAHLLNDKAKRRLPRFPQDRRFLMRVLCGLCQKKGKAFGLSLF